MIHVNVQANREPTPFRFRVETSVDGSGWLTHWECNERTRAETLGRCFASGIVFAGRECRLTMFGEERAVPHTYWPTCPPPRAVTADTQAEEMSVNVEQAREALLSGKRLRIVVGTKPDDPTVELYLEDGCVIQESVAGWSAGTVEPVCALESDFLRTHLLGRESVEVVDN